MRRLIAGLVSGGGGIAVWLALAGRCSAAEWAAALLAAAGCAGLGGALGGRGRPGRAGAPGRAAAVLGRLPLRMAIDLWLLVRVLPRRPRGGLLRRPLWSDGEGWRAFAALAESLPPNTVAVEVDGRGVGVHRLVAGGAGPELPL